MSFEGYIKLDDSATPSKSGLYFTDLSGCTVSLLEELIKEGQADSTACFNYLYKKAQVNLRIDAQRKLANRFHIDKKLATRETSEFLPDLNLSDALAGVKIYNPLPKYGRIQILSLSVFAGEGSPLTGTFLIYQDNQDGELLATVNGSLEPGRNILEVYQDFEVDTLFIVYDPQITPLRKSKNKYYAWDDVLTDKTCFECSGGVGSVMQINGGGINVNYVVYCSLEKFILENLLLFQFALLYRLGVDTMKERITTQLVNQTSLLTQERATELMGIHNEDYQSALEAAIMNIRITEDPVCFMCKSTVTSKPNLP
jgi:hypothetical protein